MLHSKDEMLKKSCCLVKKILEFKEKNPGLISDHDFAEIVQEATYLKCDLQDSEFDKKVRDE